jgi:hypothetical protein
MWAAIPVAWFWVGARVYDATGSVAADGAVALLGFIGTTILAMSLLARIDGAWVALRRRGGHPQAKGALPQVVIVTATVGIGAFVLWFYVLGDRHFIIPFMPSR